MPTDLMQVFTLCAGLLTLLVLAMAFHTGTIRGFIEKRYHNPEDVVMGKGKEETVDGPKTQRWIRAHRNSLENYVPFVVVGFLLASRIPESAFWAWCFVAFTFFRFTHAIAYISAKQPFRTLSFFFGWVITVMVAGQLILLSI